jgi:hypothetical protein
MVSERPNFDEVLPESQGDVARIEACVLGIGRTSISF